MGTIHIGISGWRYEPWRGVFYPDDLRQDDELAFASRALSSIELNGSFYALQKPESYAQWYQATPKGFVFSVKGNRFITHVRRLNDIDGPLANVLASGAFNLREKLGPFLWQFPPNFKFEPDRMERFLSLLPHDTDEGLARARQYEARMEGKVALDVDKKRKLRHAVEIRHDSFIDEAFIALLRKYKVALVVADTARSWPYYEDVCADFMYLRLHGDKELYASGYSDEALDRWAERSGAWSAGAQPDDARLISGKAGPKKASRDVFCYFDNDVKVRALFDAQRLIEKLRLLSGTTTARES
ncbi:DUF72 domain-containing protein [Massilia sp. TWP1-3-3]|uniref:DUF72 domain-containing protein n=1 Tax=Massilia sp. TWP1-3-3 TaxID=2804573 RepID=UPI003CF416B9